MIIFKYYHTCLTHTHTHKYIQLPSAGATMPHVTGPNCICGLSFVAWLFQLAGIPPICIYFQLLTQIAKTSRVF